VKRAGEMANAREVSHDRTAAGGKAMKCINCGKEITTFDNFLKIFWAPISCQTSFVWKFVCSYKCQGQSLMDGLDNPDELMSRIRKVIKQEQHP
jgi:hypothetical protein